MSLKNVTPGDKAPEAFNVVIEIPMHGDPIKYEVDKESGALFVDRFMSAAMYYPANYGYVPQTLAGDGDPVDVLVVTPVPLPPGVVVTCRAIGILNMQDEAGNDAKVLAVPAKPHARHHALFRALQRPGSRQMGQGAGLGRPRSRKKGNCRRHRRRQKVSPRKARRGRRLCFFTFAPCSRFALI